MFKRTAIISVVFIFMFAASFCMAQEHRAGADARRIEERLGQLHEMIEQGEVKLDRMRAEANELKAMLKRESGEGRRGEDQQLAEAKERIVHLREAAAEAKEHGDIEKAKRLWAESKEIEHDVAREMQGRNFRRHAEEVERKIHAMMGEAEKLARAGKRDQAHEIRVHAEKMADGLRRHHEEMRQEKLAEAKRNVVHLRELSEEAEQRGEIEKAKHLWRESKEIAGAIEREVEGREIRAHERQGWRKVEDNEIEERAESRHAEARVTRSRRRREIPEPPDARELLRNIQERLEEISKITEDMERKGQEDELAALRSLAELLEREKDVILRKAEDDEECDDDDDDDVCDDEDDDDEDEDGDDDEEGDDDEDDLEEDVDELEDEVKALRREVAELREIVKKLMRK